MTTNIAGETFGRVTGIKRVANTGIDVNHGTVWQCRCQCGRICYFRMSDIKNGSCMCSQCFQSFVQPNGLGRPIRNHDIPVEQIKSVPRKLDMSGTLGALTRGKRKGTTSKYKGVSYKRKQDLWTSSLVIEGHIIFRKDFLTEEAAHEAYEHARELFADPLLRKYGRMGE